MLVSLSPAQCHGRLECSSTFHTISEHCTMRFQFSLFPLYIRQASYFKCFWASSSHRLIQQKLQNLKQTVTFCVEFIKKWKKWFPQNIFTTTMLLGSSDKESHIERHKNWSMECSVYSQDNFWITDWDPISTDHQQHSQLPIWLQSPEWYKFLNVNCIQNRI